MTIPDSQQWLTAKQVGEAFGHNADWAYEQIKAGRSNRAGTTGIPARLVRKVGGSIHVHRSFVYPDERPPSNTELGKMALLPPPPYTHMSEQQVLDLGIRVLLGIMDEFSETLQKYRGQSSAPFPQAIDRRHERSAS